MRAGLQRGWPAPGHADLHARRSPRCRAASSPPCTARPTASRRRPCATRCARPTPTSRSCTCCPRAAGRTPAPPPAPTPATCRPPSTPTAGRAVVVSALDNLGKGAAGQAVQCANLLLGLAETAGLPRRAESRRERHRSPQGFRAAGVAAGLKASGKPDVALVVNDGPLDAAAGVFTAQPGQGRAGHLERAGHQPAAGSQAVVLNSGGANACTGAGRLPGHPRHRRARRRGCSAPAPATSRSAPPA